MISSRLAVGCGSGALAAKHPGGEHIIDSNAGSDWHCGAAITCRTRVPLFSILHGWQRPQSASHKVTSCHHAGRASHLGLSVGLEPALEKVNLGLDH